MLECLPVELVDLIEKHVAAMKVQENVRRWRARRNVRRVRRELRREGEQRVAQCMGNLFFALGAGRVMNARAAWGKDWDWYRLYERHLTSPIESVCS